MCIFFLRSKSITFRFLEGFYPRPRPVVKELLVLSSSFVLWRKTRKPREGGSEVGYSARPPLGHQGLALDVLSCLRDFPELMGAV